MNYWLTIHWPLYRDEKHDETEEYPEWKSWVFLADGYQHLGESLQVGDHVLIYETASAPGKKCKGQFISALPGRKAIIAHVRVDSPLRPDANAGTDKYEDGRQICWEFRAKTKLVQPLQVDLANIRKVMGYKDRYGLRIRGGLRKINKTKFKALVASQPLATR